MDNAELIQQLRSGNNTAALHELYKSWPAVRHFIKTHGGNDDDARDIFQDSLLILYKNARKKEFVLTSAVGTYLFSICKYLWKDELKKKNRIVSFEVPDMPEELEDHHKEEKQLRWIDGVLSQLGEKCATILKMFYYKAMSMEQIGEQLGYKNTDTVKTQKYKCLEQARNLAASANSSALKEKL
ncbi:MAG: RNA polymerase sigma factor [Flavobacteriales bacterium]